MKKEAHRRALPSAYLREMTQIPAVYHLSEVLRAKIRAFLKHQKNMLRPRL